MRNTLLIFRAVAALLLGTCGFVAAAGYDGVTLDLDGSLNCPMGATQTAYCAGDSNSTDFIIYCHNSAGKLSACSIDLFGVQPEGIKNGATCYEPSKTSGSAVCVYDGKEYDTKPRGPGASNNPIPSPVSGSTQGDPDPAAESLSPNDPAVYILQGIRQHDSD
ncbi:hypothetical protein Dda_9365 [Drechslerella dactyloides]|uniref:Secreted protein n=1 Tax=Drechslerella dactyloides TaxID=74499 RepID=A0AAD6IPL3_DREDA|nr:hypothetical protein Dda_9365 [Drechslerella dactyloides]